LEQRPKPEIDAIHIMQGIENNLVRCALGCNTIVPPNQRAAEATNDLGKAENEMSGVLSVDLDGD
jgi:hypothetical protein